MLLKFINLARNLGVNLSEKTAEQLLRYLDLLRQWNKVHNLCAEASYNTMLSYHVLDSISVAGCVNIKNKTILDVGSGAGLPGIPLSITEPSCLVTLLDAKLKKIAFINHAINVLKLPNAITANVRIEKLDPTKQFNIIISRAFSELKTFVKLAAQFCLPGGIVVAMKADSSHLTTEEQITSDCKIIDIKTIQVPGVSVKRSIIVIKKVI